MVPSVTTMLPHNVIYKPAILHIDKQPVINLALTTCEGPAMLCIMCAVTRLQILNDFSFIDEKLT